MRLFSVSSRLRLAAVAACLLAALVWAAARQPRAAEAAPPAPVNTAPVNDDAFAIVKKLIAQDGQAYDFFGTVALSGDTLAVGAKGSTPATSFGNRWSQGAVYIFTRQAGNWVLVKKLLAPDGEAGDQFGASVALEGDTLVVGAPWHDVDGVIDRGAAYVYGRNAGGANNWGLVAELTVADGLPGDGFGNSVAISGDLVVVGASYDDVAEASSQNVGALTDRGSAYVFERNTGGANNWGLLKQLGLEFSRQGQFFGAAVGVSGDVVVVGAPGDEVAGFAGRGSAFVFQRNLGGADNFGILPQLLAPDGLAGDEFGSAVAIQGNLILVGAPLVDGGADQGAAYLFSRNSGGANNYGLIKKFLAPDGADSDFLGKAVAIDGDLILIGAPGDNVVGNVDQGSAFLFARNEGGPGNWGLVQQLFATDGKGGTFEQLWNDQNAFLNQLFVNSGTNLGQNNFGDSFGNGVAISGGVLAVGAMGDDIELDEEQGSAYVFALSPFPVSPARLPDGLAGIPYSASITPADGVTPFGVVLTAGSLPPGLSLESATGVISGTPQASGDFLFTVRVTNSAGQQAVVTYGLTVNCPDLSFTTAKLPDGRVGKPYRQTLAVSSYPVVNSPLTFTTAERLPIGLSLSPSGQISGTPRISGNYTFTVVATDAYGCKGSRTFTIRVSF
jgi:hypothetical protein